jgi:hypothetical protein
MFSKRAAVLLVPVLALMVWGTFARPQENPAPAAAGPGGGLRTFFTALSAKPDDSLGDEVRKEFEDDDGGTLRSVAIDLNGDGKDEKFYLSNAPAKSGGSQWLLVDGATGRLHGLIIGSIIFIDKASGQDFPRIETYWKQATNMGVVFEYAFSRGRYVRAKARSLTLSEIDEYFRTKPPLDLSQELVDIKGGAAAAGSDGTSRHFPR